MTEERHGSAVGPGSGQLEDKAEKDAAEAPAEDGDQAAAVRVEDVTETEVTHSVVTEPVEPAAAAEDDLEDAGA
jgi:hypothetical protein